MKKRVTSALVLIICILPFILIGNLPFKILVSLIGLLAIYEYNKASGIKNSDLTNIISLISYILIVITNFDINIFYLDIRLIVVVLLGLYIPVIFKFNKYNVNNISYNFMGILIISLGVLSVLFIRNESLMLFIYILLISFCTDIFAYLWGKNYGKTKLTTISPNKTKEGAMAGLTLGTIIPSTFYLIFYSYNNIILVFIITLILSLSSMFGDLIFSSIKRTYKIKDFSNLIPGHGGVLDRIDSILFVSMTYLLFALLI